MSKISTHAFIKTHVYAVQVRKHALLQSKEILKYHFFKATFEIYDKQLPVFRLFISIVTMTFFDASQNLSKLHFLCFGTVLAFAGYSIYNLYSNHRQFANEEPVRPLSAPATTIPSTSRQVPLQSKLSVEENIDYDGNCLILALLHFVKTILFQLYTKNMTNLT